MEASQTADTRPDMFIVGFGASAGGLRPLADCLASLPDKPLNFAVVCVLHKTAEYDTLPLELLTAGTQWDVAVAQEGMRLRSNRIYVAPFGYDIVLDGDILRLHAEGAAEEYCPSIDRFFRSLAENKGSRAIGVILSGSGTDGIQGIADIKQAGGYVIVQEPYTAAYRELPTAAVRTGYCDALVPPEDICSEITSYVNNYEVVKNFEGGNINIDSIFGMITRKTGTDFSKYKPTTVLRRIEKRLEALEIDSLDLYYKFIKQNPQELDTLFKTVLIGVTEFFRDTEAFDELKPHLARILQSKHYRDTIRIWSVGCATGEEAYTIAILLTELLGEELDKYQVQIFATDIDEQALNIARKGVYPAASVEHLPHDIVEKYFIQVEQGYEVQKSIRQCILFSRHDITSDPPFVRLDLISCRNLLIYFNNDLQRETLSIFHYALNKDGFLFLGKSESVGNAASLFSKVNGNNKIFQRNDGFNHSPIRFSHYRSRSRELLQSVQQEAQPQQSLVDIAKETLYATFEHPFVVVNENMEVLEVRGSLRVYMELGSGAVNVNLLKMVNPELTLELRALFARVRKTGVGVKSPIIRFVMFEREHFVRLHIKPLLYAANNREHFLVIFEQVDVEPWMIDTSALVDSNDTAGLRLLELSHELAAAREHLQTLSEELETSNEELQALNEELQSANEELKSSNEELETSNEELQSANEELQTANAELRLINEALIDKEAQLRDSRERIKESERLYRTLALNYPNGTINIIDSDLHLVFIEGRGVEELDSNPVSLLGKSVLTMVDEASREEMRNALEQTFQGTAMSFTVQARGQYYSVRTIPLRDGRDEEGKVMFVTQNITDNKKMELALRAINEENRRLLERERHAFARVENQRAMLHNLFMQAPAMIAILRGPEHSIELVNPPVAQLFGTPTLLGLPAGEVLPELCGQGIFDALDNVFASGTPHSSTEVAVKFAREPGGEPEELYCNITFQPIHDETGAIDAVLVFAFNVTEKVHARRLMEENAVRLQQLIESIPQMAWTARPDGSRDYFNKQWYGFTGLTYKELEGWGWTRLLHPDDREQSQSKWRRSLETGEPYENENRFRSASGEYRWQIARALPVCNDRGEILYWVGTCTDIDDNKRFAEKLEESIRERTVKLSRAIDDLNRSNRELEQFAYVASHDLQEPLRKIRTFGDRLLDRSRSALDETGLDYLERMQSASSRMQKLIDDLLTFSRVSSRREPFVTTDLNAILLEVIGDLEVQIHKKNAVLNIGTLPAIEARPVQMGQLFRNLISNALKFSRTDGEPQIEVTAELTTGASLTDLPVSVQEQYCILTVRDNGIGFDNEHAERIFVIFQRLHGKSQYEGTGIGLAVCKKIVENHNGFIMASGAVNQGATFTVVLPVTQELYASPLQL